MPRKNQNKPYNEYRGSERVFRLDRDTTIIYSGREKDDLRPFIRVGAGKNPPEGLFNAIERVVLPEQSMWNIGHEMEWLDISLRESEESIEYVGSKDRIQQITRYASGEFEHSVPEKDQERIIGRPFEFSQKMEDKRERAITEYTKTGNFIVHVNGSKTLDFESYNRSGYSRDREYETVYKLFERSKKEPRTGYSFIYAGLTEDQFLPVYWNFNGSGFFLNPPRDTHYYFLQRQIRPQELKMVGTNSPYSPGFIEAIQRSDATGTDIGIFSPSSEKNNLIKKIYPGAKLSIFDDGKPLPFAKEATMYASRTGSHGAMTVKLGKSADNAPHLLFPLMEKVKQNRSFDYIRPPHDMEIRLVHSKEDLKEETSSRLTFLAPGKVDQKIFTRAKLGNGVYPLIPHAEYFYLQEDNPRENISHFMNYLHDTQYAAVFQELFGIFSAEEPKVDLLESAMDQLRKIPVTGDLLLRNTVHGALRFMQYTVLYQKKMSDRERKVFDALIKRYSVEGYRVKDWAEINGGSMEFLILFFHGKDTFLLAKEVEPLPYWIEFPPEVEEIGEKKDEYKKYLRKVTKQFDKMVSPPAGMGQTIEFMEKLFQERLKNLEERIRLQGLLDQLDLPGEEEEPDFADRVKGYLPEPLAGWYQGAVNFFRSFKLPIPVFMLNTYDAVANAIRPVADNAAQKIGFKSGSIFWGIPVAILLILLLVWIFSPGSPDPGSTGSTQLEQRESTGSGSGGDLSQGGVLSPDREAPDDGPSSKTTQSGATEETSESGGFFSFFAWIRGTNSADENRNQTGQMPPGSISSSGNTPGEVLATEVTEPGKIQRDVPVPGEQSVNADMREVFVYADALARKNGFRGLANEGPSTEADLRNPDVVFPGDTLTLPDGRLVKLEPGENIWKISTGHYKKDYARIKILARQIESLKKGGESRTEEGSRKIQRKLQFMRRLAITPGMKEMIPEA